MIIELFGAPGAGKTTVAKAIFARLQDNGQIVQLISSYRPAEKSKSLSHTPARNAVRRLSRAVGETTRLLCSGSVPAGDAMVTDALLRVLPPARIFWKLRMYQYLARLASNWRAASLDGPITLFDQAYVQAVYSLAVLTGHADRAALNEALGLVPMPDLLIGLSVPHDLVAARLGARQRRHGMLEGLLEVSPETNLASLPILDSIDELLRNRDVAVARVETDGEWQLDSIQRLVENAIHTRCAVSSRAAA